MPTYQWLLVCLGNPGKDYEDTRHNIGFMAADRLSSREGTRFSKLRYRALTGEIAVKGQRVLVLKPQTYMNLSGESVKLAGGFYKIPPERVLAHSDVAPDLKEDPGETFPWLCLAAAGLGHCVSPAPLRDGRFFAKGDSGQPVEALQAMFALYGYDVPVTGTFDPRTEAVVTAFQRHFRQARVDGVADSSTITTLRDLLASLPLGPPSPRT